MAVGASWIPQNALLRADYAMLALTSTIFLVRVAVQVCRRKKFEWQDGWLYTAYAAYLAMCILYTHITPTFFKLEQLAKGNIKNWAGMQQDIKLTTEVIFTSGVMFWTCLWCVKFSLLALYKKFLVGASHAWNYTYWSIVAFCILVRDLTWALSWKTPLMAYRHILAALSPAQLLRVTILKTSSIKASYACRPRKSDTRLLACTMRLQ
jgi:hypothetical protein